MSMIMCGQCCNWVHKHEAVYLPDGPIEAICIECDIANADRHSPDPDEKRNQ